MIATSPETAIKNIFERAATSLSDSRDQLDKTRRILKKAIHRLISSTDCSDQKVGEILNNIKTSVDTDIDLKKLDTSLDELFVLTNNSGYQNKSAEKEAFSTVLKNSLGDNDCSEYCTSVINGFSERDLTDKEIAIELVKLLNKNSA